MKDLFDIKIIKNDIVIQAKGIFGILLCMLVGGTAIFVLIEVVKVIVRTVL